MFAIDVFVRRRIEHERRDRGPWTQMRTVGQHELAVFPTVGDLRRRLHEHDARIPILEHACFEIDDALGQRLDQHLPAAGLPTVHAERRAQLLRAVDRQHIAIAVAIEIGAGEERAVGAGRDPIVRRRMSSTGEQYAQRLCETEQHQTSTICAISAGFPTRIGGPQKPAPRET